MRQSAAWGLSKMLDKTQTSQLQRCNLRQLPMTPTRAHHGLGEILFHRIADSKSLSSACNFIDFTQMPPGTTIGRHTHAEDEEEFYLVVSGNGTMQLGEDSFPVKAGDLIRNPPGGTHALQNTGRETLELFVFEVKVI